ncbi:universal stress protein [Haloferax sp. MBLA0076]|uniref:Universal stress protein n=1 Tax=Haloferax litoreum TaxID=2666140 RepID=A0A6A8GDN7_9EURY|nr:MULTISPECIES: universal stress protein [Haloferax]KAB1192449.1 universal stress protein [Haloferax sp. CBA1148]MRX20916.1 universal stress protein [Haloferax litoreum]
MAHEEETHIDAILVPTDGSKAAMRAARQAVRVARENDATIHVMYVMDMGDVDYVAVPSDIAETKGRLTKKGRKFAEKVQALATEANVECTVVVRSGIPEDEIIEYADEEGIDLIVMGKRGQRDPDKPLLGSTTKRVVGRTDVPVRVV